MKIISPQLLVIKDSFMSMLEFVGLSNKRLLTPRTQY